METLPLPRASIALGAYPFVLVAALASSAALTRLGASPSLAVAGAFAVALVTTAVLERLHPFERAWNPPWRAVATLAPSVRQDAIYLGLIVVWQWVARWIAQLPGALVALSLVGLLGPRPWPYGAPTAVQCLLAFALADLAKYGLHRLAHEHPWLWRFHAEHHAPERLHSLNGVRFHPINALWNLVLDAGIPLAIGLGPKEMLYIATLRGAVSVLQHANIDVRLGPLDWIFSTPVLHRWHHSAKLEEANANYGSTLIVWDVLFGTRRVPRGARVPSRLGLADGARPPERVGEQLLAPWRSRRSRALAAVLAVLVAAGLYAVFHVVPIEVERRLNKTAPPAKPVAPSPRATDLHRRLTVVDLHADSLLWGRDLLARGDRGHVDVPRLIEGNVALQALTLVTKTPRHQNIDSNPDDSDVITWLAIAEGWPPRTWTDRTERALHQAEVLDGFARRSDGRLTLVRTARDLRAYLARREREPEITAAWLGVEGAQALGGDLANLDRLFAAGVRMMAPTHFSDNDVGGSASGEEKPGLTEMWRELVRRMERGGMIVDLAHASARTIDDVLAIATRPVVVSHTGVRGTCDNARNLGDDQLRAIAATGGVIGIGYWPHAVCSADVGAIVRAVRHAVEVAGVDHVALGSDFDGSTTTPFDASGVVALTSALVDEGFDDDDIEKIMGKNTLRVLLEALPP